MTRVGFAPLYSIYGPSSRYRVFQFLKPLADLGFDCNVIKAPERDPLGRLTYIPRLIHLALNQDVLFIQKRLLPAALMQLLLHLNPNIIFDLDDAIYLRPQRRNQIERMISSAKIVTAGNELLANYARNLNDHVVVIPSVVDTDALQPPKKSRHSGNPRIIIGWIGTDPNRGDFKGMKPLLNWLGQKYSNKIVLRTVGRRRLELPVNAPIDFVQWTLESSQSTLQTFDIGIMPLPDTVWNRGKCGFKLIQYGAVGIPSIASPVGVNENIVLHGTTGFLPTKLDEWRMYMACLIESPDLREQMGHAARHHIERHYSVKSILPLLADVLRGGGSRV